MYRIEFNKMTRSNDRSNMLHAQAKYCQEKREEEEMEAYYEQQAKEQDEIQEHYAKQYYDEVTTQMQENFYDKIQDALEDTASTCGWIRGGTRVLDNDDDMIFIKKCLVNMKNFDISFNGSAIEYYNVIMSGSDIISMNDVATTTNMMEFMAWPILKRHPVRTVSA